MKTLRIEEETPVAALESIVESIALEASAAQGFVNRVADLVPTLVTATKNVLSSNDDKPELAPLHLNIGVLQSALKDAPFSDIVSLSHPVPAGMEGNMYDFVSVMEKQVHYINEVPAKLTAFNQFVSGLITSAQTRKSINNFSDEFREMAHERNALLQGSREFFKTATSRIAVKPYGEIVASNTQYIELSKKVQKLVDDANKTSFKNTQKLVKDTKELLDALTTSAMGGQLTEMSGASMETLAVYTTTIAQEVEMYSTVLFMVAELRKSIFEGNAKLIRALRY